jgi:exonuclease VII small subunit
MKQSLTPERFAAGAQLDRKAQRKLDQAKGLIPWSR